MSTIVLYCASAAFDLLEKAYICSDNVVLQILARRRFNDVWASCDIYHIFLDTLLKCSVHYVKALFVHNFISSF